MATDTLTLPKGFVLEEPEFERRMPAFDTTGKVTNLDKIPYLQNEDGSTSTHKMAWSKDSKGFYAFPTIVNRNGKLVELSGKEADEYAHQTGELKRFSTQAEAESYAAGSWKKPKPSEDFVLPEGFVLEEPVGFSETADPENWHNQLSKNDRAFFVDLQIDSKEAEEIYNILYFSDAFRADPTIVSPFLADWMETTRFNPSEASPEERGFFGKIAESWRRGDAMVMGDIAVYETAFEGRGDETQALAALRKLQLEQMLDPIEGNFLAELVYSGVEIVPGMARGYWEAIPNAFAGMSAGALVALAAGQIPPLTLAPEEIVTVPAGTILGMKAGLMTGSGWFWYKQGAGAMYATMRENDYDPELSKHIAGVAAIPYAVVEFLQVSRLTPGLRRGVLKVAQKSMLRVVANAVKRYGAVWSTEVFEEVVQEIIQIGAEDISGFLSGELVMPRGISDFLISRGRRLWETTKAAGKAMSLLPIPGATIDVYTGKRAIVPVKPPTLPVEGITPAEPTQARPEDLLGRPMLIGGAEGEQAEFLEKEKYRLAEPDIEGQMKLEVPEAEVEAPEGLRMEESFVEETGRTIAQNKDYIKKIEKQIAETDVYQTEIEAADKRAREIGAGVYYVPKKFKGEVKSAIESHPLLKFRITHDPSKGTDWRKAAQEAALVPEDMYRLREKERLAEIDISDFLERVAEAIEVRKKVRGVNLVALERATEKGTAEMQILSDIRYDLQSGKTNQEINANIREWAKHYGMTESDISDLIIPEMTHEQKRKAIEAAKAKDEALEKLETKRLGEKAKKTKIEQARLKELLEKQRVEQAKLKEAQQQKSKLRQRIHAVAAVKGLTQKALSELKIKHTGYRHLTGKISIKRITLEQLGSLYKAVQKVRPKQIGYKRVITKKTENKIQSLRDSLKQKLQMTDEAFTEILRKEVHGKEPKYIDAKRFITQTEGNDIIRRMLDEAEVIKVIEPYNQAVAKNTEIANQVKKLDTRIAEKPKRDPWSLESMRYYNQQAEVKTGTPFYAMYMDLLDTHLESIRTRTATWTNLENTIGKKQFRAISKDETALKRVGDYIAAQSELKEKPAMPADITDAEVKLAKEIQSILKDYRLKVRTAKFFNFYYYNQPIAEYDRFKKEINKAVDIFESKGKEDLIEYLKTQEWGVIRSGYEPLEVLRQRVRPYSTGPTTVGKGHVKIRTDVEYHIQERNILQRLASYMRQIDLLYNMSPKINAYVRLYDDSMTQFNKPTIIKENIETFLRNLKRYNIQGGFFERTLARLYSQAMRVIIMPSPVLSFRNLFQNAAFEHDKSILIDTRNKPLGNQRVEFLETYVLQTRAMIEEYFMVAEKPLAGLRFLTGLIDKIRLYPHSDIANRHWSFWAKINQVDRALEAKTTAEMMKEAKFEDMTELEQRRALSILAKDGKEAMARYVTRVHVDDIHFLYERAQRSPAEMTPLGKVVGNLFLFPRAYGEKLASVANKALNGKTYQEQWRGLKILFAVIAGGMVVGSIYRKITRRRRNPYNPLEILAFRPGGLAWGSVEAATDVYANILSAAKGDDKALAALTVAIPRAADMFIPFYDYTLRAIEAATDQKNIDRRILRQMREMIDKEYRVRGGDYKVRRNALEKWQYFIAGAGVDKEKKGQPLTIKR